MIADLKKDIDQIKKNEQLSLLALCVYNILIDLFEERINDPEKELDFLNSFTPEIKSIITLDLYSNSDSNIPFNTFLRKFFTFYAKNNIYFMEGLNFFSNFPEFIKAQKFNSIKAYVFYFAYQLKKYDTNEVKILLSQNLINAEIIDNKTYLDFCMYCFFRGMYCLENKDFYFTSYFYCTAASIGLKNNENNMKLLNNFNCQMIRSLCFLKFLTKFEIRNTLLKGSKFRRTMDDIFNYEYQDIDYCLNFINEDKKDLKSFREFILYNLDNFERCNLQGLMKAAEGEIIFKTLKELLKIFKKTKMSKLAQMSEINYADIMRILKKKVLEGELSIKYDEAEDIIEVFDIDPGLKEKVEKTKESYGKIIEGNKNLFLELKDKKLDELSGKNKDISIEVLNNGIAELNMEEYY